MADSMQPSGTPWAFAQSNTACRQVLETTELLEAILYKLDSCKDIVLAQKVNSTFRDCIQNSPSLQQRLFFRKPPTRNVQQRHPKANHFMFDHKHLLHSELQSKLGCTVSYRPRTVKCPQLRICCYGTIRKNTDGSLDPYLKMYCGNSASRHVEIRVDSWSIIDEEYYSTFIKVTQQPFGDLVEVAGSLQALGDSKIDEFKQRRVYDRGNGKTEDSLDPQDRISWRKSFPVDQRETIVGTPNFKWF